MASFVYASRDFWLGAAERAVKTGAQFFLMVLGVGVTAGVVDGQTASVVNALALDYLTLAGAFAGGVLVSLMTSLAFPKNVPAVVVTVPVAEVPDGEGVHRA